MKQKISDQKMPEKPKTKRQDASLYSFFERAGCNLSAYLCYVVIVSREG